MIKKIYKIKLIQKKKRRNILKKKIYMEKKYTQREDIYKKDP